MNDISLVICGAAGQGIKSIEEVLVAVLKMSGLHVFSTSEFMSRVRGGMNSTELRISQNRVAAYVKRIDILVPLHHDAIHHLQSRLNDDTIILTDDTGLPPNSTPESLKVAQILRFPLRDRAKAIGNKIYSNIIAAGILAVLFKTDKNSAKKFLSKRFQAKGEKVVTNNIRAFEEGYQIGLETEALEKIKPNFTPDPAVLDEVLFNGNEAVGLGALAGGCNFISAYPMSPSTGALIFLAKQADTFEIVVDQAEGEIAAINKAIGAWYAGARALVSTSGGGFALMTEGLSLAAMMESPLVVHIAQRPGPATGLPTRTGQEDLNLALYAGPGEFPRIIFAPGTITQAVLLTQKAFQLADEYQVPIFILTDQYFVDSYYNVPEMDISEVKIENSFVKTDPEYRRYQYTDTGISPRGVPGLGSGLIRVDSDEHDEEGQITEDMSGTREKMQHKRLVQKGKLLEDIAEPPSWFGSESPKMVVISWGSNYQVVQEAIHITDPENVAMIHFHQVYPLHPDTAALLQRAEKMILLENNATGQFKNVLKLYADISIPLENCFLKSNGEPFAVEEVAEFIQTQSKGGNQA